MLQLLEVPYSPFSIFLTRMKKKLLPLLALSALIAASLLPFGIKKAHAVSYDSNYTCHYRDTAGRCLSRQVQNPYYFGSQYGSRHRRSSNDVSRVVSPYGNRQTYPFRSMFNAYETNRHTWDNRYNNRANLLPYFDHTYRYLPAGQAGEEDDDDNDYIDEDDDAYYYFFNNDDHNTGEWRRYYDLDVNRVNLYRYQSDDDDGYYYDEYYYDDRDRYRYGSGEDDDDDNYDSYRCFGSHCRNNYYRY